MRKIGILGGTFNPIHNGHLLMAEYAASSTGLDEIWFIPAGIPYLKAGVTIAPGEDRMQMLQLAIDGNPMYKCLDIELRREGYTYTYETLMQLRRMYPSYAFYFICGADCLFYIENWKQVEKVFENATLLCTKRGQYGEEQLASKIEDLQRKYPGAEIDLFDFPGSELSSTSIRKSIAHGNRLCNALPDKVYQYILNHKLYQDDKS